MTPAQSSISLGDNWSKPVVLFQFRPRLGKIFSTILSDTPFYINMYNCSIIKDVVLEADSLYSD